MQNWLEQLRQRFTVWLVTVYWRCETWRLSFEGNQFFAALPVWAVMAIIAGASFGANLGISYLLKPKRKASPRSKPGDFYLTDSVYGADIPRIYGARPAEGEPGGIEVGCNIFWMSDIRVIDTPAPGGGNGGGKGGGGSPPPNIQRAYKVDIAGVVGVGELRLLRMKWNEDTVYSIIGGGPGGGPSNAFREAESGLNTLAGGASVVSDAGCSGGQKVTGIGSGGSLRFNLSHTSPGPPPDPQAEEYLNFKIAYKSTSDATVFIDLDGEEGPHHFPSTGGTVGYRFILRPAVFGAYTLKLSNPSAACPDIDYCEVFVEYISSQFGPSGGRNEAAPTLPARNNILLPNPYLLDTYAFERFNAAIPATVNNVQEIPLQNGASLAWYEGSMDQPVDSVIEASISGTVGANSTPAFRGFSYFRIQNLDFTSYGSPPAIRCVVENTTTNTVEEILAVESLAVGLESGDLDLSGGTGLNVRGYLLAGNEPPAKAFQDLGLLHNLASTEDHDGNITLVDLSTRTSVATLTVDDLAAYVADESDESPLDDVISTVPEESEDLTRSMELQFINPLTPSDYSTDHRTFHFPFTDSKRKDTRQVNITMIPDEAQALVRRVLQRHHQTQTPDTIMTWHKYAWLNAGQCITLPIDGVSSLRRIAEKTGATPGVYEMALINEDIYVLGDGAIAEDMSAPVAKTMKSETRYPATTIGTLMNMPPIVDDHKGKTGIYVAACPWTTSGQWKGAQVFRMRAGEYLPLAAITKAASMGIAVTTVDNLTYANAVPYVIPTTPTPTTLVVDFYGDYNPGTIPSVDAADGGNPFLIGKEICVVRTWTRNMSYRNRWEGTNIYRAVQNTRDEAGTHATGERVVLLDDSLVFVPIDIDERNVSRDWKFVTQGGDIVDSPVISFAWEGKAAHPTSIFDHYTNVSNTTVAPEIIYTHSIPARTFYTDGDKLRAFYRIEVAANANEKTVNIAFNSTTVYELTLGTIAASKGDLILQIEAIRTDNDSVRFTAHFFGSDIPEPYGAVVDINSLNFNTAYNLTVTVTGEAVNDFTGKMAYGVKIPAA